MSILLSVKKREEKKVRRLGARLLADGKTWIIPDEIKDINGFKLWLPVDEGFFVQRPYLVLRSKCSCWKCRQETPVIALGALCSQYLVFGSGEEPVWTREEGFVLFSQIEYLDEPVIQNLQKNYDFFRQGYLEEWEAEEWGCCCVHCGVMQEADGDYRYGYKSPFHPRDLAQALEIRVIYFDLPFDYYINSGYGVSDLLDEVIR